MSISRLDIRTELGAVQLRRTSPSLEIARTSPSVRLERRMPQVQVDRTDYRAAVNVRGPDALGDHLFEHARQRTQEAIGAISAEGDTLARIEVKSNTIATVAQGKLVADESELELRMVPPPVRTTTDPGGVRMEGQPGTLRISATVVPLEVQIQKASVDMDVRPRLNVTA